MIADYETAKPFEVSILADTKGRELFELRTWKTDGETQVISAQELMAALVRLDWKVSQDVHEIARGFYHLASLPQDAVGKLFENLLPHVAMSEPMVTISCALQALIDHLGDDLRFLLNKANEPADRGRAAERLKSLLSDAVEALLEQANAKPSDSRKQVAPMRVDNQNTADMPYSVFAIQELIAFVENQKGEERRLPSNGQLHEKVEKRLGIKISTQRWSDVMAEAGLNLPRQKPEQSRKKGRLDEVRAKSAKKEPISRETIKRT